MCGFSVYFHYQSSSSKDGDRHIPTLNLEKSLDLIHHRGPDARGTFVSTDGRCGLGHVRLSIIDLEGGQQPLSNVNNDVHAVVNGELYDHDRLMKELEEKGHHFKTRSDSELALHFYEDYDTDFLENLRGEFAIAIWDEKKSRLMIARDRFGIKPVYYTIVNGTFLAASEIKAFLPLGWQPEWDVSTIIQGGVTGDYRTCFKGVYKLPPAHYLTVSASGSIVCQQYWDADYPDKNVPDTRTVEEMIQGVHDRFIEAVRLRLRADVPLAVYLSGGIDSSSVVGVATHLLRQDNPNAKVDVFSISFPGGEKFDEGDIAERTAAFCGSNFHRVSVSEQDLVDNFAETIWHTEQPIENMNGVGKFLLSKHCYESGFKVVMTGEGSDEHFIGYQFFHTDYLREADKCSPGGFGTPTEERRIQLLKEHTSNPIVLGFKMDPTVPSKTANRWNNIVMQDHFGQWVNLPAGYYRDEIIQNYGIPDFGNTSLEALNATTRSKARKKWHPVHASLYLESRTFLPNTLLNVLGDRSEMAHSVEARTPFLDHHLCEYVNHLPPSVKLRGDGKALNEKWILKEAMKPYISEEIYNRTKHPFLAPPARGSLKKETPVSQLIDKYLTKAKVDRLGWASWPFIEQQRDTFLKTTDPWIYKNILLIISYIVISEQFDIAPTMD
ncbi:putative asparagine synthase [Halteromyces radiatus]|uniref:putative asparagine synthase n=1 Tax=Halteromyces radiatus TaxID=101107 RepID=UPI00221EBF2B|nr:putative asparagine synthase [Halteromyces radiatus]KAI8089926.1 putative asparagine synthase [Halteromyces radiatus]